MGKIILLLALFLCLSFVVPPQTVQAGAIGCYVCCENASACAGFVGGGVARPPLLHIIPVKIRIRIQVGETVIMGAESVIFVTIILLKTAESATKTAVAAEVVVETTNILSVRMDR